MGPVYDYEHVKVTDDLRGICVIMRMTDDNVGPVYDYEHV